MPGFDVAGFDSLADSVLDEYNEAGNILALTVAFLFNGKMPDLAKLSFNVGNRKSTFKRGLDNF